MVPPPMSAMSGIGAPLTMTRVRLGVMAYGGRVEVSGTAARFVGMVPTTIPAFGAPAMSLSSSAPYCVWKVASEVRRVGGASPWLTAPRKSLPPIQMAMKVGWRAMA